MWFARGTTVSLWPRDQLDPAKECRQEENHGCQINIKPMSQKRRKMFSSLVTFDGWSHFQLFYCSASLSIK